MFFQLSKLSKKQWISQCTTLMGIFVIEHQFEIVNFALTHWQRHLGCKPKTRRPMATGLDPHDLTCVLLTCNELHDLHFTPAVFWTTWLKSQRSLTAEPTIYHPCLLFFQNILPFFSIIYLDRAKLKWTRNGEKTTPKF